MTSPTEIHPITLVQLHEFSTPINYYLLFFQSFRPDVVQIFPNASEWKLYLEAY